MKFWIINGTYQNDSKPLMAIEDIDGKWLFVRQKDAHDAVTLQLKHSYYCTPTHLEEIEVSTDELLSMILGYGRKDALAKLGDAIRHGYDSEIVINRVSAIQLDK